MKQVATYGQCSYRTERQKGEQLEQIQDILHNRTVYKSEQLLKQVLVPFDIHRYI